MDTLSFNPEIHTFLFAAILSFCSCEIENTLKTVPFVDSKGISLGGSIDIDTTQYPGVQSIRNIAHNTYEITKKDGKKDTTYFEVLTPFTFPPY